VLKITVSVQPPSQPRVCYFAATSRAKKVLMETGFNMSSQKPAMIVVVEDEAGMRNDLVEFLGGCGFNAVGVGDAASFYRLMVREKPDLVLLDIRLPGESGLEVARHLRDRSDIRVIILSAQSSGVDQVDGLNAGADAYLIKQTPLAVIEATCHSVLRRAAAAAARPPAAPADEKTAPAEIARSWRLDTVPWVLQAPNGTLIKLTHAEQSFLSILFRQPGRSVKRSAILAEIGKADTLINRRNLDSCVRRIRSKVMATAGMDIPVESSYGIGYVFQGPVQRMPGARPAR
jgi:two-component system OmpR family response regulator